MSTLKTTYVQHPSAVSPSIELSADGSIVLPLSGIGDLADVDEGSGAADGDVLTYDGSGDVWVPAAVGGLVAVKSANLTSVFSASVASGANTAVTGLAVTHATADAANDLLVTVSIGIASDSLRARVGFAVSDGSNFLFVGDADGSRLRITSGANNTVAADDYDNQISFSFIHSPGSTTSTTYTVHLFNLNNSTQTMFVNKSSAADSNSTYVGRGASSIIIQEVSV